MSDVIITVRGEHELRIAPERATVHLNIRAEGPQRVAAVDEVTRLAEPVRQSIVDRKDAETVVEWSSTRMTVHAERPWNADGRQLAPVYHATIAFTATFPDPSELSLWVSDVSLRDGVEVGVVDWQLTPETRTRLERDVAAGAVSVAVARAEAYAAALGLDSVVPLEVADLGLISRQESAPQPKMLMRSAAFAMDSAGSSGMVYEAEDIIVSATVEARFQAA